MVDVLMVLLKKVDSSATRFLKQIKSDAGRINTYFALCPYQMSATLSLVYHLTYHTFL